ncbi:MAG: CPBP family intramembrane metalloprotease [Moraxella sp.]|nr:CPBP family intramembrane metalloprotease [Moraxella sp.]
MIRPYFSLPLGMALCFLTLFLLFFSNALGLYLFSLPYLPTNSDLQTLIVFGSQNGTITALSVMFTACVLLLFCGVSIYLKTRSFTRTKAFFNLGSFNVKTLTKYVIVMIFIIAFGELLMVFLDSSPMTFLDNLLTPASFWWLIITIVVVAPIYEEIVFRGLIFGIICSNHQTPPRWLGLNTHELLAIAVSSSLFAMVHLQYDVAGMMIILALGVLFCHARIKHGLGLAVLLHFLNNALTMITYLFFGGTL